MKDQTNDKTKAGMMDGLGEELEMFLWHVYESHGEIATMQQLRESARTYLGLRRRGQRTGGKWIAEG